MGDTDRFYSARFYSVTRTSTFVGDRLERWSAIVAALASPRSGHGRDDAARPCPPTQAPQSAAGAAKPPVGGSLFPGR